MGCDRQDRRPKTSCLTHHSLMTERTKKKKNRIEKRGKNGKMISSLEKNARVAHPFWETVFFFFCASDVGRERAIIALNM